MRMGAVLLLEISAPVNLNHLCFLILLKKEQIPEYLVSSPSVLRCPHVRPAVSLSYFINPRASRLCVSPGTSYHLGQELCLPPAHLLRVRDPNFPSARVGTRSGT